MPYSALNTAAGWVGTLDFQKGPKKLERVSTEAIKALVVFFLLGFVQCAVWGTFGQIPTATEQAYNVEKSTITLLLNWGAIVYLPVIPLSSQLLTYRDGLRRSVLAGAFLSALGSLIRLVPSFMGATFMRSHGIWFLHAGQILNGATGCVIMGAPARLSREWFPQRWWGSATAVGFMSMGVGSAAASAVAPHLVSGSDLTWLLLPEAILAFVTLILALGGICAGGRAGLGLMG